MKNLILIIGMFVASNTIAQLEVNTQKDSILFERTGIAATVPLSVYYWDEFNEFSIHFQDNQYQHITVIEHISIGSKENLIQFCELVIKSCAEKGEVKTSLYTIYSRHKKLANVYNKDLASFYISVKECQTILDRLK